MIKTRYILEIETNTEDQHSMLEKVLVLLVLAQERFIATKKRYSKCRLTLQREDGKAMEGEETGDKETAVA